MQCHAVQCYVVCYAMLCNAICYLCYTMQCHAMLDYATLRLLWYRIPYLAMLCCFNAMTYYPICEAIPCQTITPILHWLYQTMRYVVALQSYTTLYYKMLRYTVLPRIYSSFPLCYTFSTFLYYTALYYYAILYCTVLYTLLCLLLYSTLYTILFTMLYTV